MLLALVAMSIAACDSGSSDDSSTASNPPPPPPPPQQAEIPPRATASTSLNNPGPIGTMYWNDGMHTPDGGHGDPVDGLPCEATSPAGYHAHAHLSIFLNGDMLQIPAWIGFVNVSTPSECHYPLHTHDASGMLHLHATAQTDYTLGQFFNIWGRPLTRDNVADFINMPIRFFVTDEDNVVEEHLGDPAEIVMLSHREITIVIGTDIDEIPYYTWNGD